MRWSVAMTDAMGYSSSASKGARLSVPAPPLAPGVQPLRIAANDVSVTREAPRTSTILNVFTVPWHQRLRYGHFGAHHAVRV